jgi:hypothetical protein
LKLIFNPFAIADIKLKIMNTKNLLKVLGVVLFSLIMVYGTSCKKEEVVVTPPPAAYVPGFSATYFTVNAGAVEVLDFYITCTTDDWEMIKVNVIYPGGAGNDEFPGSGALLTKGNPFTFTTYFPKLGGSWTFNITGNIKSGDHLGESFTVSTTVNISAK